MKYDEQIEAWYQRERKKTDRKFYRIILIGWSVAVLVCLVYFLTVR